MIDLLEGVAAHALNVGFGVLAGLIVIASAVLLGHGTMFSVMLGLAAGLAAPVGGVVYACIHME